MKRAWPWLVLLASATWLFRADGAVLLRNPLAWTLAALLAWQARSGAPPGLGAPRRLGRWIVPGLAVLYGAGLCVLTLTRHQNLQTYGCDLGIFDNVLWNTRHGRWMYSSILGRSFFGEHASPILLLLVPLHALWPDPRMLLAVQAAALAWAGLPIYRVAARQLGPSAGLVVLFLYFAYPPLQGVYLFDFHEVALAVPLLAYAYEHASRGHYRRMVLLLGLALLCKEEMALTVGAFGLLLLALPRAAGPLAPGASGAARRRLGLTLAAAGAVLFLLLTLWVVPYFRQAPFPYVDRYSHLGGSLAGVALTALTHPGLVMDSLAEPAKDCYLRGLFGPVLYLNCLHPASLLLLLPTLARSLLSNHAPQYALHFHFLGPLVPFVFFGLAGGLGWLLRRRWPGDTSPARRRGARRARLQLALGLLFLAGIVRGTQPGLLWRDARRGAARRPALDRLLRQVPPGASVCAHNHLGATVSGRREASVFPDVRQADCVLLDFGLHGADYPLAREEHVRRLFELVRRGGYGVREVAGKFVLLQRGDPSADAADWVRRLFLVHGPEDVLHLPARRDPVTRQWFPGIDLVADRLFPAGEYCVRYELRARRPLRPTDRCTLLAHPRWGEFTGSWALAERTVTAADFAATGAARRATLTLDLHLAAPTLLGLQLVGAESAGIEWLGLRVEPRVSPPAFAEQMARAYEQTAE